MTALSKINSPSTSVKIEQKHFENKEDVKDEVTGNVTQLSHIFSKLYAHALSLDDANTLSQAIQDKRKEWPTKERSIVKLSQVNIALIPRMQGKQMVFLDENYMNEKPNPLENPIAFNLNTEKLENITPLSQQEVSDLRIHLREKSIKHVLRNEKFNTLLIPKYQRIQIAKIIEEKIQNCSESTLEHKINSKISLKNRAKNVPFGLYFVPKNRHVFINLKSKNHAPILGKENAGYKKVTLAVRLHFNLLNPAKLFVQKATLSTNEEIRELELQQEAKLQAQFAGAEGSQFEIAEYQPHRKSHNKPQISIYEEYFSDQLQSLMNKVLDPKIQLNMVLQTVKSLEVLHSLNIVHGDIKPSNILFKKLSNETYKVALTDLGLSFNANKSQPSQIFQEGFYGSISYTAPELFGSPTKACIEQTIDLYKADCFALGVTWYEAYFENTTPWARMAHTYFDKKTEIGTNPEDNVKEEYKAIVTSNVTRWLNELKKTPEEKLSPSEMFKWVYCHLMHPDPENRWSAQKARVECEKYLRNE